MFTILKNVRYLRFWLGQIVSQLGDGITRTAIVYLIAILSKDPLAIGLALFAQLLPNAIFGIVLGPLADKYNRRHLMVAADLYRCIIVLLMIPFHHSVTALIILIAFQGLGSALFDPARTSSIPDLAGESNIQEATSLSQSTRAAMDIIGPSLGALLMVSKNFKLIFLLDAATFIISALFIFSIASLGTVKSKDSTSKEKYIEAIRSGIKEVTKMPALRFLLILLMPITLVIGVLNTNLIAVLTNVFHVSAFHFGTIEATMSVGVILGAAAAAPYSLKKLKPAAVLLIGTAAIGFWMAFILPLNTLRLEFGIAPVYVWCIISGLLNAFINVPLSSLFLQSTPAAFRGRGSSLLGFVASSFQMAGILAGGWIAREIGVLNGTALAGCLLIVTAILLPLLKGYKSLAGSLGGSASPVSPTINSNSAGEI